MLSSLLRGDKGIRTLDPLLARQVLSQLSYTPKLEETLRVSLNAFATSGIARDLPNFVGSPLAIKSGNLLLSHTVASIVPSAVRGLTIVFGMGTGVTPGRIVT